MQWDIFASLSNIKPRPDKPKKGYIILTNPQSAIFCGNWSLFSCKYFALLIEEINNVIENYPPPRQATYLFLFHFKINDGGVAKTTMNYLANEQNSGTNFHVK